MYERTEALMRIVVLIITGIILGLWKALIQILVVVQLVIVMIVSTKNKELANFCDIWNKQVYAYLRYVAFVNNKRPFPFGKLVK